MKRFFFPFLFFILISSCSNQDTSEIKFVEGERVVISNEQLKNKIKGAWAGQTIGVTYGGPTEFKFNGTIIQDYVPIRWEDGIVEWWYKNAPGLYDDIYMDLTFVEVFDRLGLDAPADSFAMAFATAEYALWHANQAARVNILNGIMPPESGHWLNNPHADCIDYQIEADFAGIMSPGMVNAASEISDKIGHIMNYGDGWYGGVYVGAMYALAFISDDVEFIVKEALKTIPVESSFYQCINETIESYYKYPDDWKRTWFMVEKKWSEDVGCPDGVLRPFNIDAKVNAAYIVIGLLYGNSDFYQTIDISTRCGQDSDCNPASAGGILGTILGYENIPGFWKDKLYPVEDIDFKYTDISLKNAYKMSYMQALENINRNGGKVNENEDFIEILYQEPEQVAYEVAFGGLYPVKKESFGENGKAGPEFIYEFSGTGIVLSGNVKGDDNTNYAARCEVYIDDVLVDTLYLRSDFTKRSPDFYWNYNLDKTYHTIKLVHKNPENGSVNVNSAVVYSDEPFKSPF
ncbi:MAG: ADP-ribosylglycohydrolase family protein [Bacteroidota bacterium]